jgi:hypothetical protein
MKNQPNHLARLIVAPPPVLGCLINYGDMEDLIILSAFSKGGLGNIMNNTFIILLN